jgi:hypothetical protein
MSLINEALKKAQKQRTGESPSLSSLPSIGGEKASQIARRGAPAGFNTLLLRLGVGMIVLVGLIVGGVLLFRGKSDETPPATVATTPTPTPQPAAMTPATVTPPPVPAPVVATTPAAPAGGNFVVPNVTGSATPSTLKPEPVQTTQAPAIAQVPVAVIDPPKPEPARPAAPLKLEPRAINYIEGIRVAGIRASATDSKVLMNDRVYRLNDTVEHEMGLRLVEITSHSLTFEDDRGARYTRSF